MLREREHPGVLAGAIAPAGRQVDALRGHFAGDLRTERRVGTAGQVGLGASDGGEHAVGHLEVTRLARVRGAGEGQRVGTQAEPLQHPVLDQRQGLERLGRGAPERDQRRVSRARR